MKQDLFPTFGRFSSEKAVLPEDPAVVLLVPSVTTEVYFMSRKLRTNLLLNALDQFGLNPKEWDLKEELLKPKGEKEISPLLLIHKEDPGFRLLGLRDKKGWLGLQLLSL